MNFSVAIWNGSVWELAGWTMIHFAWIGTLLLILTILVRLVLRRAHPTWRYATTLALFAVLAISPVVVASYLATTWPATPVAMTLPAVQEPVPPVQTILEAPATVPAPASEIIELTELDDTQLEALAVPTESSPIIELTEHPEFTLPPADQTTSEITTGSSLPGPPFAATADPQATPSASLSLTSVRSVVSTTRAEQLIATLDRVSQYLPWLWLIGAPLTFALLATGLVGGERLRRSAELLTTGPIVGACETLRKQLKITRRVAIAVTDRVAQPVLVGIVRPMILLPWAALHGWRHDEIEMVLVHELAHVRRWDNLVNLGQRVVESLLFYHPAVWLVSRWLRHDREECCDAVVVAQTGEPAEYANLLISVASQLKPRRSLLAASAMAQHPLTRRIRRLLQLEDDPMLVSRTSVLMGVAALMVAAAVAANYPLWAEQDQPAERSNESAPSVADEPGGIPVGDVEVAKESEGDAKANSPFLSLEDQRVADLAYKILGLEVQPLPDELRPLVEKQGFKRGVQLVDISLEVAQRGERREFRPGDVLVGLHVWEIEGFESLGETLRRNDLDDFNPLKAYILRPTYAEADSPSERNQAGGRGGGRTAISRNAEDQREIERYQLITARIEFKTDRWEVEQIRIGNQEAPAGRGSYNPRRTAWQSEARGQAERQRATPPRNDEEVDHKRSQLRYDGKSFDEWRSQWRNELKVEERIEAIKAMTAFGRAGYGREAAESIMDVAREYNIGSIDGASTEWSLVEVILNSFEGKRRGGGIPTRVWMPLLKERLAADVEADLDLAVQLLQRARLDKESLPFLEEWSRHDNGVIRRAAFAAYFDEAHTGRPEVVEAIRRALGHSNVEIVNDALSSAASHYYDANAQFYAETLPIVEQLVPELLQALFRPEEEVRKRARWLIASTDDKLARRLALELVARIEETFHSAAANEEALTDTRIAALRALGALGPRARHAMESLKDPKRLFDGPDIPARAAFAMALYQILGMEDSGDRDKMGAMTPLWESLTEGLNEEENKRLETRFLEEASLVFPRDEVPPSASDVVKYIKEEFEKAIQERERQPPAVPGGSPGAPPVPGTLPE